MTTVKLFSASELKNKYPEGFESAHESWRKNHADYAWIKDNVIDGAKFKRVNYTYENEAGCKVSGWRYDLTKKNGESWSCEFTGVCYDHDFLDSLLDDIKSGCTLQEAFCNLASTYQKLLNNEIEDQMSESYFVDHADANEYKFTKTGQQIYL